MQRQHSAKRQPKLGNAKQVRWLKSRWLWGLVATCLLLVTGSWLFLCQRESTPGGGPGSGDGASQIKG
ncbi:hypothetical protein [Limosilactobacillus equigenerosi]|uniref:hypothetical protein n=1 Tax=Limosilactobacillus equigenerosi TaxID=417373 RepID=UPI0012E1DBBD|nr:hypothetical protein [Limosilactobacillus equigenerosi]